MINIVEIAPLTPRGWSTLNGLANDFIGGQNDASRLQGIEKSKLVLTELMRIKGSDPFLGGPSLSIGDLYLAPACAYLSMTPDAEQVFAINGFADWWDRIQALPSFKATPPQ